MGGAALLRLAEEGDNLVFQSQGRFFGGCCKSQATEAEYR